VLDGALRRGRLSGTEDVMDELGEQLAGWGKALRLETRGRTTGRPIEVAIGYIEEPDGAFLVAAGSPETSWARNLESDPSCRIGVAGELRPAVAEPLAGPDANGVVRELILKYGTPAERLGRGRAYRLRLLAIDG
jgi:deazaflavin-dependent oxidoreductase (nitroreductase family)